MQWPIVEREREGKKRKKETFSGQESIKTCIFNTRNNYWAFPIYMWSNEEVNHA